jgi:hypothetical protein
MGMIEFDIFDIRRDADSGRTKWHVDHREALLDQYRSFSP